MKMELCLFWAGKNPGIRFAERNATLSGESPGVCQFLVPPFRGAVIMGVVGRGAGVR